MAEPTPEKRFRVRLSTRDGVLLITSVLLALLSWLLTNLSREYSGVVSVPVVAECNPDGRSNLSSNTVMVSARCRTTGYRLMSSAPRKALRVKFDRADMHPLSGDRFYVSGSAKNSYIGQFFGESATVEAFITDTLMFVFRKEMHKKVPVELVGDIYYRSQYMAESPVRVLPDSVTVYGSPDRLEAIDRVKTTQLALDDVHQSEHGMLRLMGIKGVRLSEEEVSYELSVVRYVEILSSVPVEVWNAPAGKNIQVFPPQAEVVLRCRFPVTKDPLPQFKLYIDYQDFASSLSGRCIPRSMRLPAGVIDYRLQPEIFDCIELN